MVSHERIQPTYHQISQPLLFHPLPLFEAWAVPHIEPRQEFALVQAQRFGDLIDGGGRGQPSGLR